MPMLRIQTVHFVGGLGAHKGRDLQPSELLAIRLAKHWHPAAEVFLHTAIDTWSNYRELGFARRLQYASTDYDRWPHWRIEHGAHMSDKLRLQVLLHEQPKVASLYLDTDAYCCRNLDYLAMLEGCALARSGPYMLNNGLIYAGTDRSFLAEWWSELLNTDCPPPSFADYSCRMAHNLATRHAGVAVLDNASFHGADGDNALWGYWAKPGSLAEAHTMVARSQVVHTLASGWSYSDAKSHDADTRADLMLLALERLLNAT